MNRDHGKVAATAAAVGVNHSPQAVYMRVVLLVLHVEDCLLLLLLAQLLNSGL